MKQTVLSEDRRISETTKQPFSIASHTKEFTEQIVLKIQTSPAPDQAQKAFQIFHKEQSNVFFDSSHFFQNLHLSLQDIEQLKTQLLDLSPLEGLSISKENIPTPIDERMSLIDFLGSYVFEKGMEEPSAGAIVDCFASVVNQELPQDLNLEIKRIAVAEKMDSMRMLTLIDRDLATQILNDLAPKMKEHLRSSYYIGLKASGISDEEYSLFVSKVL
jgi:hypothetical protein